MNRDNEDTAIMLMKENISLKDRIKQLETENEELKYDVEYLEEKYKDLKKDLEDNYVPRWHDKYEEYGVSERDFI